MLVAYRTEETKSLVNEAMFFFSEEESRSLECIKEYVFDNNLDDFNLFMIDLFRDYFDLVLGDVFNYSVNMIIDQSSTGEELLRSALMYKNGEHLDKIMNLRNELMLITIGSTKDSLIDKGFEFIDVTVKVNFSNTDYSIMVEVENAHMLQLTLPLDVEDIKKDEYYYLNKLHDKNFWLSYILCESNVDQVDSEVHFKGYKTKDIDHIIEVCKWLDSKGVLKGSLYYYGNEYYLFLELEDLLTYKVSEYLSASNLSIHFLDEYGKKITDSLQTMVKHF